MGHLGAAIGILVLTAVFSISASFHLLGSSLNLEIKPLEILSTLLSAYFVYVAASLQTRLGARSSNDRVEKDILLRAIQDCQDSLKESRDHFVQNIADKEYVHPDALQAVSVSTRKLNNSLEQLEAAIKISRFKSFEKHFEEVKELARAYKACATGLPIGNLQPGVISNERKKGAELRMALIKVAFELNLAEPKVEKAGT